MNNPETKGGDLLDNQIKHENEAEKRKELEKQKNI